VAQWDVVHLLGGPQNGGGGNFACELKSKFFSPHPMNVKFSGRKGYKKYEILPRFQSKSYILEIPWA
jgi:hypothetical protein